MYIKYLATALLALSALSLSVNSNAQSMPPLQYYGELPSIEEAVISPSGNLTALLAISGGQRIILILDSAGSAVKQIAVGEAKVRSIEWVGESAILLLRTETGRLPRHYIQSRAEFLRGNVIPLDESAPVISIFAKQRFIANAITSFHGVRHVEGRWLGYFGGFRRGSTSGNRDQLLDRAPALFAVDLMTGDADLIDYPDDYPSLRSWLVDEDGNVAARLQIDANNGDWRLENGRGTTVARGNQIRGDISILGLNAGGQEIIYSLFDDGQDRQRRFSVPIAGGESKEIWKNTRINQYIYQPFSRRILGIRKTDRSIELADADKQAMLAQTLDLFSYALRAEIADLTPDFSALVARTSGNFDSGTWFRIDGRTGNRAIIGLERPAIQGPAIGQISIISYEAQDGLEIDAILTLPPGREPKNLPVVVLPHGGPRSHDVAQFDWWAQAFASRGYAVLQPNFRGSTGRGTGFIAKGDGEWGRKMQTDKSDGLAALVEQGIVDPERACIVGASYGGYAALAGVTIQNGIYRCAVSVNGVAELQPMLNYMQNGSRNIVSRSIQRQFGKDTNLDAISPTKHAKNADAPVLLIHGRDDTVVPFAQSVMMEDALSDAGKSVELIALDGEDHWLSQSSTRRQMLEATIDFVERHNPPD